MTADEIAGRQLRAWAIETALGKQGLQQQGCEEHHTIDIKDVIEDAKQLTYYVVNGTSK